MKIRLTIIALMLTALTAGAWTQEQLMRRADGVRGAAPVVEIGNAVDLNGSTEYLIDNTPFAFNGLTAVTLGAWVKVRSVTDYAAVINIRKNATTLLGLNIRPNFYKAYLHNGVVLNTTDSPANSLITNTWQFVVMSWEGGTNYLYLYVNGVQAKGSAVFDGTVSLSTTNILIGLEQFSNTKFNGLIDEVFCFANRGLVSNEVVEVWNNGIGKPIQKLSTGTNGLVRLWHLDESGSASNAYDSASGTTATGTSIGSGDWVTGKVPK